MLATKVILILAWISTTIAQKLSCHTIMKSFYQTEDQYYDLGCDRINKDSEKVMIYRCRFLQKKMDIMGKNYYDFGDWSPWSECINEKIQRIRKSCTGRQEIESYDCSNDVNQGDDDKSVGNKILIATGRDIGRSGNDYGTDIIIDVENSTFTCNKFRKPFPVKLYGATGALISGQTPFICGGYDGTNSKSSQDCYKLNEAGTWTKDQTAVLNTARRFAGTGSVVINNKLVLSGGSGSSGKLKSIELVSPNERSKTLSVQLPFGLASHCSINWDSETVMIIGGYRAKKSTKKERRRAETYFINVKTNTLKNGPSLNNGRHAFACEDLKVQGKSYIVVSGGSGGYRSTEVLDKANIGQGWQRGPGMPIGKVNHEMVSSPNKKSLYSIGGRGANLKFICTGAINTCKWTKIKGKLKRGRFVAIPIPNSLANKLCN